MHSLVETRKVELRLGFPQRHFDEACCIFAGFTKEVFDKALSKHAPRYVMSSGSAYTPRPQSSSASSLKSRSGIISEGNSDCVICQSPDIWKAYVESQQQNNEQQSAPDEARVKQFLRLIEHKRCLGVNYFQR